MDVAAAVLLQKLLSSPCGAKLLHFMVLINEKREQDALPFPLLPMVPVSWRKASGRFPGTSAYCLRWQLEPCMCVCMCLCVYICMPVSSHTEQT